MSLANFHHGGGLAVREGRMRASLLSIAVAALAAMASANAGYVTVGSRAAFQSQGPFVAVDWGVYGPAGTLISTPEFRTVGAVTVGVASSQGVLSRHDEGTDFTGDFAIGDHLLTDAGSLSDTSIVSFAAPVRGFGMQIERDAGLGAWTGSIDLFDSSNTLLDSIVIGGTRGTAEDNSAPFYGVVSSSADISYAYFWVDQPGFFPDKSGNLAINTMDVLVPGSVPEPSGFAVFGAALLMFAGLGIGRRYSFV
jgi:hypothetical protein